MRLRDKIDSPRNKFSKIVMMFYRNDKILIDEYKFVHVVYGANIKNADMYWQRVIVLIKTHSQLKLDK